VLSDNGSAYRSKPCQLACEALGLTPKRTRPNTPRTNGKAERFIKTLESEWAYGMSFQSSAERNRWLSRYLAIYNRRRRPMALAGRTPFQELALLRATEWPGGKTYLGRHASRGPSHSSAMAGGLDREHAQATHGPGPMLHRLRLMHCRFAA